MGKGWNPPSPGRVVAPPVVPKIGKIVKQMSKQSSNMAHQVKLKLDQLKQDSEKSKIKLITQKELINRSITRLKKDIRNLHWSEDHHKNYYQPLISHMTNWWLSYRNWLMIGTILSH